MNTPFNKLHDERGSTLVEALVSAVLMIIIATAVFGALEASGRASAQERHRARAYAIAQEDQARLRSLKVSAVSRIDETRTVTQDGISYTVRSIGAPKLDRTATAACDSGNTPSDYIAISSTVRWDNMATRPPVVVESLVAPPNGSLDGTRGALGVSVVNGKNEPYVGLTVTGSGAGSFSGQTTDTGCIIFGDLPGGNYNVSAAASNLVDAEGNPAGPIPTNVVSGSSNTLSLQYDRGGTINTTFRTKVGNNYVTSSADSITAFNTGMTAPKSFGSPGGNRTTSRSASPLFPFLSSYAVYAGSCSGNKPGGGAAQANVTVPAAGSTNASITLPALNVTVYGGSGKYGSAYYGSPVANADVVVTDTSSGCNVSRALTTNSAGKLADPGLPWGTYDVCVDGTDQFFGQQKKVVSNGVAIKDPANPQSLTVYLFDGSGGSC